MLLLRRYDLYLLGVLGLIQGARWFSFSSPDKWLTRILAELAFRFSTLKRHQIERNLKIGLSAYAGKPAPRQLILEIFRAFWIEMFEWARDDSFFAPRATVHGAEHLQTALARGKGAILWESSGFGGRIATQGILTGQGYALTPIHAFRHFGGIGAGDDRNSWVLGHIIHAYFDRRERKRVREIIYLHGDTSLAFTRTLLERLSQNQILSVAFEGPFGQKGIVLEFLGQPRRFATGTVNLAKLSGAALLPVFCTPTPTGGYALEILPPLDVQSKSTDTVLRKNLHNLESRIRAHPEWYRQWNILGSHREHPPD